MKMKQSLVLFFVVGLLGIWSCSAWAAWSTPTLWPHNTKEAERMPAIAGNTLYYVKSYDIWQSTWDGTAWNEPQRVPGQVNSAVNELNPSVVQDGTVMYFVRMNGSTNYDFFRSEWDPVAKEWGEPEVVTALSSPTQDWDIWVSNDETVAYITSAYTFGPNPHSGDRNIYRSERSANGVWSAPVSVGAPINSSADEWDVSVGPDGRIYFCSNRPGGNGDYDIYVADSLDGPVTNLTAVNSVATEKSPGVSGKWLAFEAIHRAGNVTTTGYDVWISTWE